MFKFEFNLKHKLDVIDGLTWNIKDIAQPSLFACAFSSGNMNFNFCNLTFHIAIFKFLKNRRMFNQTTISQKNLKYPRKYFSIYFFQISQRIQIPYLSSTSVSGS